MTFTSRFVLIGFLLAGCSSSGGDGASVGTLAEGAVCKSDSECAAPGDGRTAKCQCTDGKKDQVCVLQLAIGAKCPVGTSFSVGCSGAAECINEKCQEKADLGGSCDGNICKQGLACDGATKKCVAGKALGEKCDFVFDDCAGENWCEFPGTACVAPRNVGEKCDSNNARSCVAGAACGNDGKCVALGNDGDPCTSDRTCKSNHCTFTSGKEVCGQPSPDRSVTCGGF
ncbi:MAG: hypothetical protein ACXVEE_28650 [Polyangiales bacterium]